MGVFPRVWTRVSAPLLRCSRQRPLHRSRHRFRGHGSASRIQHSTLAGSGIMDSRQLQRVDRSARRQPLLGLSLPRAQFLRTSFAQLLGAAAQACPRRVADCRRQRLELVVRPRTPLRQRPRIRRALPQASLKRLPGAGSNAPRLSGAAHHGRHRAAVVPAADPLHPSPHYRRDSPLL